MELACPWHASNQAVFEYSLILNISETDLYLTFFFFCWDQAEQQENLTLLNVALKVSLVSIVYSWLFLILNDGVLCYFVKGEVNVISPLGREKSNDF